MVTAPGEDFTGTGAAGCSQQGRSGSDVRSRLRLLCRLIRQRNQKASELWLKPQAQAFLTLSLHPQGQAAQAAAPPALPVPLTRLPLLLIRVPLNDQGKSQEGSWVTPVVLQV